MKKGKKQEERKPVPPKKRTRKVDDELTTDKLKDYIRELDKDIKPKHLKFLLAFISNGFVAYKAYQSIYKNCSKSSAECLSRRILKRFDLKDLLWLCDFGYDRIISDLRKVSPEMRLKFLIKLHRLDYVNIDLTGSPKMQVTVICPPKGKECQVETETSQEKKKQKKRGGLDI